MPPRGDEELLYRNSTQDIFPCIFINVFFYVAFIFFIFFIAKDVRYFWPSLSPGILCKRSKIKSDEVHFVAGISRAIIESHGSDEFWARTYVS